MQIKEITATYAMTVNTGAYENMRVEAGATATIDEGEDPEEAHKKLLEHCKIQAAIAAAPAIRKRSKLDESVWNGLPDYVKAKFQ